MKLLIDQNLSHRLVGLLAAEFPGSAHVRAVKQEIDMCLDSCGACDRAVG